MIETVLSRPSEADQRCVAWNRLSPATGPIDCLHSWSCDGPTPWKAEFFSIAAVTVISEGAAIITLTVDVRSRPGILNLAEGLMRIAILGGGALVALTDGAAKCGCSVSRRSLSAGRVRALAAFDTSLDESRSTSMRAELTACAP